MPNSTLIRYIFPLKKVCYLAQMAKYLKICNFTFFSDLILELSLWRIFDIVEFNVIISMHDIFQLCWKYCTNSISQEGLDTLDWLKLTCSIWIGLNNTVVSRYTNSKSKFDIEPLKKKRWC